MFPYTMAHGRNGQRNHSDRHSPNVMQLRDLFALKSRENFVCEIESTLKLVSMAKCCGA